MDSGLLPTFSCIVILAAVSSLPTSPTLQRLGSDEIRITPRNRDVCLAKLLCGMSVVTLEDAYNTGNKDGEIYGDYAQIVGKFFQENPPDEFEDDDGSLSLSVESVEAALEDYSVSAEDEHEEEVEDAPVAHYHPKRPLPHLKKKIHMTKRRPAAPTTAAAPIQLRKVTTPKPTPPGIQIFDMGMPVQEVTSKPKSPKSFTHVPTSRALTQRISRARKIMRRAGLATKLRTVRQCQRISGCTYAFKQLYQKYGGKGIIDEISQPMQPLHVVDEQWSRRAQPQRQHVHGLPEVTKSPFENTWISPVGASSPAPTPSIAFDMEYGTLNAKIPPGLEAYFQASSNAASLINPGTTYKIKKGHKPLQSIATASKKQKRKKPAVRTTTTTTSTTTTTTTEPPTTTTTTTTTAAPPTTTPPRRQVHYKRPPPKRRPSNSDDDEDDNINETAPVKLIGNREHDFDDEVIDRKKHQVEYEDEDSDEDERKNESHDDYDEEEKYNVPVDYGNDDDEDSDEQDDEDRRPVSKTRPMKHKTKADHIPEQSGTEQKPGAKKVPPISPPILKYRPRPSSLETKIVKEFESVQNGRLKRIRKKGPPKESKETTSEEAEADDFDQDEGPPPFEYPTQIGGRPIFPDYGIPVTAYGVTRSQMQTDPRPSAMTQSKKKKTTKKHSARNRFPMMGYRSPPPQGSDQSSADETASGFEPSLTTGMSMLSPIKNLFKHLSSGISPNPVGGSMGYTPIQSPSSLHYKMPPGYSAPIPSTGSGSKGDGSFPLGITVPLKLEEADNPNIPQIAIMPQIPKGPESSEYKRERPAKYTVNKTNKNKIPSL